MVIRVPVVISCTRLLGTSLVQWCKWSLVVCALLASGCASLNRTLSGPASAPVAASPFAGSVHGSSFEAKSAMVLTKALDGSHVWVLDSPMTCAQKHEPFRPNSRTVDIAGFDWKPGFVAELSPVSGSSFTAYDATGKSKAVFASGGRIEVISFDSSSKRAVLRARVKGPTGNMVEGDFTAEICD